MIPIINGNILATDKDIIVQQVNSLGIMGGGLAKEIAQRYPEVKKDYQAFVRKNKNKRLLGQVHYADTYDGKIVANVFGQQNIRQGVQDKTLYTSTVDLIDGIKKVKEFAEMRGFSVALPTYIGCGMANGNWNEIKPKIEAVFADNKVDVIFYHYRR